MSSPYTPISVENYNLSPPSDDGSEVQANQLTWAKHKTKIGDPLKAAIESLNTNVASAFTVIYGATQAEIDTLVPIVNYQYEPLNIKRYGADPTGVLDSAAAIRDAIKVANASKLTGNSGVYGALAQQTGTNPEVDFGDGIYKVGSSLTTPGSAGTDYVKYVGRGAQLIDAARTVDCFTGLAWDVHFEGIKFRGFNTQVAIDTNNVNRAMFSFKHVEFIDPATSAVVTSSDSNSTEIIFDHFTAHSDEAGVVMFDILVDVCVFRNYWVQTACDVTFINRDYMLFEFGVFVPESPTTTQRWIDNYGERLIVKHARIGGEGGGKRLFDHRKALDSSGTINPVQVIIEDTEYYAVGEWARFYEFPNLLQAHFADDTDTVAATGIWVDAVTATQLKDFARYGTVDIDPRWGRTRVTNNAEAGAMFEIKNLKSHPMPMNTPRIAQAAIISRGDAASGWGESTTTTGSAGTNTYGAVTRIFTATAATQSFDRNDTNCFVRGEMSRKPYTFCQEIRWSPASGVGQCELFARIGWEQYITRLMPGTHMYCFPFQYLNGGGAGDDTDLDSVRFESGARLANGDVCAFGVWTVLDGVQFINSINMEIVSTTAPSAISGTVGPNQSYFIGDIVWESAPVATGNIGNVCVTAGDPGTWKTFGVIQT